MKNKIYIRADGSSKIGLGHLIRCISLAHMLNEDFELHFFSLEIPNGIISDIVNYGWYFHEIQNEEDFFKKITGDEIIVLDGYQFDSNYQKEIKSKACKLVCIDDFHNQFFYADLVINHAPGVKEKDYAGESYTKYLLGANYALLRPEFFNLPNERKLPAKEIHNVLICFGGSDPKNLSSKILKWIPPNGYSIVVIIGNSYTNKEILETLVKQRNDLNIKIKSSLSAKEMRNELLIADLAVLPASGVSLEALILGIPSIIGYYTSNQLDMYQGILKNKGFYGAIDFSKEGFLNAFNSAISDYQIPVRIDTSEIKNRLNVEFETLREQSELIIRLVNENDVNDIFDWANDSVTRLNSFNKDKIEYKNHITWFSNKLNSSDCVFIMFENKENEKIGFVRFDKDNQGNWIISININPTQRGKGYSVILLHTAVNYFRKEFGVLDIHAYIKKQNIASSRAFIKVGFKIAEELNINNEKSVLMVWK